jgi:competence protein ComFC
MNILKKLLERLFPEKCFSCQKEGEIICIDCGKYIETEKDYQCPHCKRTNDNAGFCSNNCSKWYEFNKLIVCTRYQSSMRTLIKLYKYRNKKSLYSFFGGMMWTRINEFLRKNTLNERSFLIPVPIDKKKLRDRAYNHCELISKFLSQKTGIRHLDPLIWINYKGQQAGRSLEERINSRKNTMAIKRNFLEILKNSDVFLIEDIVATCSTVNECSRVLRSVGVRNIYVFVLSRK